LLISYPETPTHDRRIRMMLKFGLFGYPGAGKSASAGILSRLARGQELWTRRIRLAEPLYECQQQVYRIAGLTLSNPNVQDGELLNFLGTHLRKINPRVLLERFESNLNLMERELERAEQNNGLILCDDVRAADADFVRACGFTLIRISASPSICRERRRKRGDLTAGCESHPTEEGMDSICADLDVVNDASLEELEKALDQLLSQAL
jgi:hypothetical protein